MRRLHRVACAALLLVGAGSACQSVPPTPSGTTETTAQALTERTGDRPTTPPIPFDEAAERLAKEEMAAPLPVDLRVDQAAAATHDPLTAPGLAPADRDRLLALPLPVLLPDNADLLEHALITTGARWYSASIPFDGHTVLITGRARGFRLPAGSAGAPPARDGGLLLSRTDGIVNLTFRAYGVPYTILVECESPLADPRCTGDEYAMRLAQELGRVEAGP